MTTAAHDPNLPVGSFVTSLNLGEAVDFLYSGGVRNPFRWRIACRILAAPSADEAVSRAHVLQQSLSAVLERCRRNYRFQPVTAEPQPHDGARVSLWSGQIQPQRVTVEMTGTKGRIGFAAIQPSVVQDPGTVLLPRSPLSNPKAFDSLAEAVACCPVYVHLTVSVSPVVFDRTQLKQIRRAIRWLESIPEVERTEGEFNELELAAPTILAAWRGTLVKWLENARGLRLSCSTFSERPVPTSFLEMLGREIFPGLVTGTCEKSSVPAPPPTTEEDHAKVTDLANCFLSASSLPPLFPTVAALTDMKSRRFYNADLPVLGETGISLGFIKEGTFQRDVRFADADRSRHCYILGATGTGKSTLLFNMIVEDIRRGNGVGVIDPHGDLHHELLAAVPRRRVKDVVVFDPGDHDFAAGLNFLECAGANRRFQINYIVNELLKILDRIYDMHVVGGPMFETYFRNALMLLLESDLPNVTLLEFQAVFADRKFREFLKRRCKDPFTIKFWTDVAEKVVGDARLSDMAPYVTSKLSLFTQNAMLRPIVGQAETTIRFREIMDRRGILLVNLSKGILGESDTQLLGMLLIGKIFGAALGRASLPPASRVPFSLYVDEFQNFTTDTVAHLLSEARKFGLQLTLANQNLAQLSVNRGRQHLLDAVLGNVGSLIVFRLGAPDAEKMRVYTRPEFTEEDLQDLPNFHAAARILTQTGPTRPFVFQTRPKSSLGAYTTVSLRTLKTHQSRYSKPIAVVEAAIAKRLQHFQELSCGAVKP